MDKTSDPNAARKDWLGLLAQSPAEDVARRWAALGMNPSHTVLRAPEVGGIMVRGRAGAVGAAFNLGEMTVTRASVKLADGTVGHGYVQGRGKDHAVQSALVDALMQTQAAQTVIDHILTPLRDQITTRKSARAASGGDKGRFLHFGQRGRLMQAHILEGGFADQSIDASFAFRAIMTALAHPGEIKTVKGAQPPAGLGIAAGVILLTLCDRETPLYLSADHDTLALRDWITFHTGAPFVAAADAHFALGTWDALPLCEFPTGTAEYPDRSATLIVESPDLTNTGASLRGPGIKDQTQLSLPETAAFQNNARLFPLGLDFIFTAGDRLAALPRTTKVS